LLDSRLVDPGLILIHVGANDPTSSDSKIHFIWAKMLYNNRECKVVDSRKIYNNPP